LATGATSDEVETAKSLPVTDNSISY